MKAHVLYLQTDGLTMGLYGIVELTYANAVCYEDWFTRKHGMWGMKMKAGATFRRALRDMGTTGWLVLLIGGFALMGIRDVLFAVATGGILESALEGSAEAVALYLGKLMQAAFLSVPL